MNKILTELSNHFVMREDLLHLDEKNISLFLNDAEDLLLFDYRFPYHQEDELVSLYEKVESRLKTMLDELKIKDKDEVAKKIISSFPAIRSSLNTTVSAILEGDPAAISAQQVVLEYPGFAAILAHRIAHEFYRLGLKMVSRYISEKAHSETGIDINPGATIGDYFFIDHGTGIVIGETAIIGEHVKIYQGVTLGALSLSKGKGLAGVKRHPTIEDNVTIYSSAAIFGGETVIGANSTIGSVVYLTHSVPKNSLVYQTADSIQIVPKRSS